MNRWQDGHLFFQFCRIAVSVHHFQSAIRHPSHAATLKRLTQMYREATSGLLQHVGMEIFWAIELPLAWPGIVSAMVITFAHTR
jgi:ABC-type molybdate transport system permease subunit